MARYFFHIMNGQAIIDADGTDCADLEDVRYLAIRTAGEMLAAGDQSWSGKSWRMVVADEANKLVFEVSCSVDRHGL